MKLRKFLALLFALALSAGALAGCGGNSARVTSDGRKAMKVFLFLNDHESPIYKGMIEKFQEAHADTIGKIDVQITTQDEYDTTLTGMMTAGDLPDVFYVGPEDVEQFAENGYIENLTPYLDSMGVSTDGLMRNVLNSYRYNGEVTGEGDLYALPKDSSVFAYAYNQDLFDAAGLSYPDPEKPYTYDEFVEVCKQLTKDTDGDGEIDQWGCGFANMYMLHQFVWSNGAAFTSEDGKTITIDTPEFVECHLL